MRETGDSYLEARERLLSVENAELFASLQTAMKEGDWGHKLVAHVARTRLEHREQCEGLDELMEAVIRESRTSHVPNRPVSGPIRDKCLVTVRERPELEPIILEHLFKYNHPPHARHGIVQALGVVGTEQALEPLRALMNSKDDADLCADCVRAIGNLSMRLKDRRVVPDLVELYRTRPHGSPKGLPDEYREEMPPWLHARIIWALEGIGGSEALKALEELRATEEHPALISALDKGVRELGARVQQEDERERSEGDGAGH